MSKSDTHPVVALVDGDILIYRASAACERPIHWGDGLWTLHSFLDEAIEHFETQVSKIVEDISAHTDSPHIRVIFALSDMERNWRKQLDPRYKADRADKRSPLCRGPLYEHVMRTHTIRCYPTLEADDVIGLLMGATGKEPDAGCVAGHQRIAVSVDKDLLTIAGTHYDPERRSFRKVTKAEADKNWMLQTLTGDPTDGYKGCPKIGPVSATKLLDGHTKLQDMWRVVEKAYHDAGCAQYEALLNARLARICRRGDYDMKRGEVSLWTPSTGKRRCRA